MLRLMLGKGFLGGNDHELSIPGIGSEMIAVKALVDGVNVFLKAGGVIVITNGFVEGCVICKKSPKNCCRKMTKDKDN